MHKESEQEFNASFLLEDSKTEEPDGQTFDEFNPIKVQEFLMNPPYKEKLEKVTLMTTVPEAPKKNRKPGQRYQGTGGMPGRSRSYDADEKRQLAERAKRYQRETIIN